MQPWFLPMKADNLPKFQLITGGDMPCRATQRSAAYDCYARTVTTEFICGAGSGLYKHTYGLGFSLELPDGIAALLLSRSSIHKVTALLSNGAGLGDPDYPSEYGAVFYSNDFDPPYKIGDRCCQILFVPFISAANGDTANVLRTGGYGSTGNE